jgi:hypothetical protein
LHDFNASQGVVTYDPFPPEVCNADFNLDVDPLLASVKRGDAFGINLGEVYSPGKFYMTHIDNVSVLEKMTEDLK